MKDEKREKVMVVPVEKLFHNAAKQQGFFVTDLEKILENIYDHSEFIPRIEAEHDPVRKQIIPYCILNFKERFFRMRRFSSQFEERLHEKLSIGIGGHINPGASRSMGELIRYNLKRELAEEVKIMDDYDYHAIGFVNDDSNEVGKVHFGIVYFIHLASDRVAVNERDKMEGTFVVEQQLLREYNRLETWSQLVVDELALIRRLTMPYPPLFMNNTEKNLINNLGKPLTRTEHV